MYRSATHARLLNKCKGVVWPNAPDGAEYYLADSAGVIISDTLVIDQPDGTDKQLEWTLDTYLKVSRVKYQSKARFNILRKLLHEETDSETSKYR